MSELETMPDMNAAKRSLSPHSDSVYTSKDGRLVRVDVDAVPMNDQGKCRMWDVKKGEYIWIFPIDAKEWISQGVGSWTEVKGSTVADGARALIKEEGGGESVPVADKLLSEMDLPELVSRAEALGVKVDGRWGEVRVRNVIDAKMRVEGEEVSESKVEGIACGETVGVTLVRTTVQNSED